MKSFKFNRTMIAALMALAGTCQVFAAGPVEDRAKAAEARQMERWDLSRQSTLPAGVEKGLSRFRAMPPEELDFTKTEQAKAVPGVPMKEFMVRLDALKDFGKGSDPEALLVETGIVHSPLLVDGKVRGTIAMSKTAEGWEMVSMGETRRAQLRDQAVGISKRRLLKRDEEHFLVKVPAMNLEFVGSYDHGVLVLSSIVDDPDTGVKAGDLVPAAELFQKLVPIAAKHDGLPG